MVAIASYGVYSWQREKRDIHDNLLTLSGFFASASQEFFDDLGNNLDPLGELLDQIDVLKNPEAARPYLNNFQSRHLQVHAVAVFAANGPMLINNAVAPGKPLPDLRQDPPYFRQLLRDMSSTARYTLGPPEFGKILKVWRFSVRHVVRDRHGKPKFLVQAAIPLEKEGMFLNQLSVPANGYIGLLRGDGYLQARFPVAADLSIYGHVSSGTVAQMIRAQPELHEGFFIGASSGGEGESNRMGAYTKLADLDMYAYVSVPTAYLSKRWWQNNAPIFLSFGVFLGLFIFIAYRVTRHELIAQANRDVLTGLPNRACLTGIMNSNIASASAGQKKFAILFLDLDRFKGINDTFGHAIGDKLLVSVSRIIRPLLRGGDVLGRFGGDEFLLILPGSDESGVVLVTQRILDVFNLPFEIDGHALRVTPSIGIAIYPDHGADVETLLKHADTAMYESKRLGRNAYTVYVEQMGRLVRDRLEMEQQLRDALQTDAFRLFYQPIVDMQNGEIVAVEALLRWVMPDGHIRMPGEFIHIAEDSGVIIPLGEWILNSACSQLKKWLIAGFDLKMAVNLSTRQFQDTQLTEKVMAILRATEVDAAHLELEVTESAAMLNPEQSMQILGALTANGVRIAIDDFGTGYSSLSYLKRIPAHTIKIDKMFVDGLGSGVQDETIVRAVIALATALGKDTVAEGIESQQQFDAIRAMGGKFAQGYLISVPLDAEALTGLMMARADKRVILISTEMFQPK